MKIIDSDTDTDHGTQVLLCTQDCKYKDRALLWFRHLQGKPCSQEKPFRHLISLSEKEDRKEKRHEGRRDKGEFFKKLVLTFLVIWSLFHPPELTSPIQAACLANSTQTFGNTDVSRYHL